MAFVAYGTHAQTVSHARRPPPGTVPWPAGTVRWPGDDVTEYRREVGLEILRCLAVKRAKCRHNELRDSVLFSAGSGDAGSLLGKGAIGRAAAAKFIAGYNVYQYDARWVGLAAAPADLLAHGYVNLELHQGDDPSGLRVSFYFDKGVLTQVEFTSFKRVRGKL